MNARKRTVLSVMAVLCLGAVLPGVASAGTLDQQQPNWVGYYALFATQIPAQTFTAGMSGRLDQVDLSLIGFANPQNPVTVEVRNAPGGQPDSTVLAATSIPDSEIGTALAFVSAKFAAPPSVAAGTQYSIDASSASTGNDVAWGYLGSNPYPTGGTFVSFPPSAGWTEEVGDDLAFRTYVVPPSPGKRCKHKKKHKKKHKSGAVIAKKCRKKHHH